MPKASSELVLRALHTTQGEGLDVFSFFIKGSDIVKIADLSRLGREDDETLKGFQRPEIRSHVKGIADYISKGNVLFPNAIILALSPQVRFVASRGTKAAGDEGLSQSGTLTIPIYNEGQRVAWIVDGQQRSLALAQVRKIEMVVPVVGFVSDNLNMQREQFILVNKARPLPNRLIDELLPETSGILLPRDLTARKVPSEICNLLNRDPSSPFYRLIKRASDKGQTGAVITDTAVSTMIRNSIDNPLGALAPYKANIRDAADIEAMYRTLINYWSAVKAIFPQAWGKELKQSRLMHSAGIIAMGVLMDRIYARLSGNEDSQKAVQRELTRVVDSCRWTSGTWETLGLHWNEIENTPQSIKKLQNALIQAYTVGSRQ
jgi:DGQHR domain-containing protein